MSLATRQVRVGRRTDMMSGPRRVDIDGRRIVLVRVDDEIFALEDTCSHENASLAEEGEVDTDSREIECCRHGARFSLADGTATALPATTSLRTYPVLLDGDDVFVELA